MRQVGNGVQGVRKDVSGCSICLLQVTPVGQISTILDTRIRVYIQNLLPKTQAGVESWQAAKT